MDKDSKLCLVRWKDYSSSVANAVQNFRCGEELLDLTLACDGHTIRAHKLVLAASSQYFREVLKDHPCEHPTVVIYGISWSELLALLHYMYYGEVLVEEKDIKSLLFAAASLSITGLGHIPALISDCQSQSEEKETDESESIRENDSEEFAQCLDTNKSKIKTAIKMLDRRKDEVSSELKETDTSYHKSNLDNLYSIKEEKVHEAIAKRQKLYHSEQEFKENLSDNVIPSNPSKFHRTDILSVKGSNSPNKWEVENASLPEDLSVDKKKPKKDQGNIFRETVTNGDNHYRNSDEIVDDISDINAQESGDSDTGPSPLPLNHPAVIAASSAHASAGVAAMVATVNGGRSVGSPLGGLNYAALLAGSNSSLPLNPDMNQSSFLMPPLSLGNGTVLSTSSTSANFSLPTWLPQSASSSPSTSPPPNLLFGNPAFGQSTGLSSQEIQATLDHYQRKLAFHEPRPCPTCKRMYRDAATLRTHMGIMHHEGVEPFSCTCGCLFRTKYDMYQHKKNGHR